MKKSLFLSKTLYVMIGLLMVSSLVLNGCGKSLDVPVENLMVEDVSVVDPLFEPAPVPVETPVSVPVETPVSVPVETSEPFGMMETPMMETPMMETHMSVYKDGTYFEQGTYQNPSGTDAITVQLEISNDRVKNLSIGILGDDQTTKIYQQKFADGIGTLVVGKSFDEIGPVGAVNGSSLTHVAFEAALQAIKQAAQS